MLPWGDRPLEEASLFNPVFCALLLRATVKEHRAAAKTPLSFPLAFLVLPFALHEKTRLALPASARTMMTSWLVDHPELVAGFGERARRMADTTREAIQFGCHYSLLRIEGAGLDVGKRTVKPEPANLAENTEEARACYAAARLLGKWLASGGTVPTVMSLWGVSP
ncbi:MULTISPECIES: three component ABC system middle component [Azospirillum]|jgi:hypothetical protein|uniref:Three component ABC system middle component n=1 Tax=Azospirillum brasilense TaxID=192 RepID=A0ABU4P992_AZOBR|nr:MULTISPECIES: three component ABC system middle component [Azospirillum]MDW7553665.1 three component ABC system middle component [Azospirillum brasilense]MDW7594128.1 three component ABC system middle component [Azospirillum brasilense]MDW7628999.1 three component ABC system middle component [Azospirillum brasilense]MDX5953856.1 three component ABC system middle component [Azospirillum brasilense]